MKIANFDFSKKCQQIAEVTEGLSGREISKIAIAWQVSFEEIAGEMVFIQVSKMNQNFFGFVPLRFVINKDNSSHLSAQPVAWKTKSSRDYKRALEQSPVLTLCNHWTI